MPSNNPVRCPTAEDLDAAWDVVRTHLTSTPVVPTALQHNAMLKLDTFQPTGSFKVRGALAAMNALPAGERAVTASAGNHGLGMAFAASAMEREATVVVPETASPAKIAALGDWPVELVRHGAGFDAAEKHALDLAAMHGRYVSAYNDADVIAGQSTIGRELAEQVPGPLTVVCGLGGGGLCSGLALWASTRHDAEVIGVEAAQSRAVSSAIAEGHIVRVPVGETLADGLEGNVDDPCVTPEIIAAHAADVLAVEEHEIVEAMRWLFRHHGLVVEGAGAVGVAAVLAGKVTARAGSTLVVALTGRNIARETYRDVLGGSIRLAP